METNKAMGRPKKLTDNRTKITTYLDNSTIEAMDDYVHTQKKVSRDYSRADFVNDAIQTYLKSRGGGGDDKQTE
jgi:hypothetical protein